MEKLKGPQIFLIDAAGAVVSIIFLLFLYVYEEAFGMPKNVLNVFLCIVIMYSLYSTTIYFAKPSNWKFYLTVIAILNIAYCFFTIYHIFKNLDTITPLGHTYFIVEILVVLTLSICELRLATKTTNS